MTEDFEEQLVDLLIEGQKIASELAVSTEAGIRERLKKWLTRARRIAKYLKAEALQVGANVGMSPSLTLSFTFSMKGSQSENSVDQDATGEAPGVV